MAARRCTNLHAGVEHGLKLGRLNLGYLGYHLHQHTPYYTVAWNPSSLCVCVCACSHMCSVCVCVCSIKDYSKVPILKDAHLR